jgi:hypothetical protein
MPFLITLGVQEPNAHPICLSPAFGLLNSKSPVLSEITVYGDCLKLAKWVGPERRAAVVIGFEHEPAKISLDPLFRAFEAIAAQLLPVAISPRCEKIRHGLVHPVHQVLRVAAWEVPSQSAPVL